MAGNLSDELVDGIDLLADLARQTPAASDRKFRDKSRNP
jgi:hypothetical protein